MSSPANPLDVFTTYTYHFELHAAPTWEALKVLVDQDQNATTGTKEHNGTLLINTRKDAHQVIDEAMFSYIGPSTNYTATFTPSSEIVLTIQEPNNIHFIEKLANLFYDMQVTNPYNLQWGLKIFFVGRRPDNSIEVLPETGVLIPMNFVEMTSDFTYQGGIYKMRFFGTSDWAGQKPDPSATEFANSLLTGYCNKNISLSAVTVKEAISELERKLNENYRQIYDSVLNNPGIRPIKYKINLDPEIDGKLSLLPTETFAKDSPSKMNFSPSQTILSWIYTILRSSEELNKTVGESIDKLKTTDHQGVKLIGVLPRQVLTETELNLEYDIKFYVGGDRTWTFDYLFADPGKNVDIMNFSIDMVSGGGWFANSYTSNHGVDRETGQSGRTVGEDNKAAEKILAKDHSAPSVTEKLEKITVPGTKNDVAFLPGTSTSEMNGYVRHRHSAVSKAKMMFATVSECGASYLPNVNFTIRGNLDLLKAGIIHPDGTTAQALVGLNTPSWLKVNIKDNEGNPFFYTGKYVLIQIDNIFSGGRFTQVLHTMMNDVTTGATQAAIPGTQVQESPTVTSSPLPTNKIETTSVPFQTGSLGRNRPERDYSIPSNNPVTDANKLKEKELYDNAGVTYFPYDLVTPPVK